MWAIESWCMLWPWGTVGTFLPRESELGENAVPRRLSLSGDLVYLRRSFSTRQGMGPDTELI